MHAQKFIRGTAAPGKGAKRSWVVMIRNSPLPIRDPERGTSLAYSMGQKRPRVVAIEATE